MGRLLRGGLIAGAGVIALATGVYFGLLRTPDMERQDGATLLALSLPNAAGVEQSLSQWPGKVLVVNFWATWCAPCREEMPEFMRAQNEYGSKGLQFVGIAVDQADKVEQFSKEFGLNYPTLIGGYGAVELSRTLGNKLAALPFTIVVDRQGRIVHTQLGPLKPDKLRTIVEKLL